MVEEKSPPRSKPEFFVYKNPTFSAALTAKSLQPSKYTFLSIFSFSTASLFALLAIIYRVTENREDGFIKNLTHFHVSQASARFLTKCLQWVMGLVFLGTLSALFRALSLHKAMNALGISTSATNSKLITKEQGSLTAHQKGLLGLQTKPAERIELESMKKPPKSRSISASSPSGVLVPIHHSASSSSRSLRIGSEKHNTNGGKRVSPYNPSMSPISPSSLLLVPSPPLQASLERQMSTPWSKQRWTVAKEIPTEAMLEQFLADSDKKIVESTPKVATPNQSQMTPPATLHGFGMLSPGTVGNSATSTGTTRSTPLRPVRMSPGSQKYNTPPKKGEGDLPPPMSMEQTIEAFESLGIYPHIEQWRDRLRQWFSSVLLNPLLKKIETSHIQVIQAADKVGISVTVSQVGSHSLNTGVPSSACLIDGTKDWQPAFTLDEDGLLHQLRAALVQARDSSASQFPLSNLLRPQQIPLIPVIQECVDAITEHQRLHALMKGDWVKGLLPQSSVRADYTVQRVRELAEGTCLKNYEYLGTGEVYDKVNKKWTLELPTDSHLLVYLFCAFLEHPKWMLHVDPTSYASAQSSKNPLFLGFLPPKERFPEKYVAIISSVPSILHPGACILVVGKQSPPIFALYWDKKMQFSLQGRTALWDAVLLVCDRIKLDYGGFVHGMHLGSSALSLLAVLDTDTKD
ncbi:cytochrome B561, amino-terminal protein isoform X2 [Tasmannia lanceolata]|uniref:cytochrome B561, amino-terminal protein isoform X2 n=1 Tax=Tasmannia lanceolata TaxID=3420 RepID=UPI004063C0F7